MRGWSVGVARRGRSARGSDEAVGGFVARMKWKQAGAPFGLAAAVVVAVLLAWRGGAGRPAAAPTSPSASTTAPPAPRSVTEPKMPEPAAVPAASIVGPVAPGVHRSSLPDVVQPTPVAPRGLDGIHPEPVSCPPGGTVVGSPKPGGESYGCSVENDAGAGVRVGRWWFWTRDGNARTGSFENGAMQGTWTTYYPDGKVARVEPYDEGRQQGTASEWDGAGKLSTRREFKRGVLDGESLIVYPDGSQRVELWRDGTLVDEKTLGAPDGGEAPSTATP